MCGCFWSPARPVYRNHELVEFQPWTVTGPDLRSGTNSYTIYISLTHLFQLCFGSPPPSPRAYLLSTPNLSPIDSDSLSLCTHFYPLILPGSGATVHLDGDPTRRPPPLVCISIPFRVAQRISLREIVPAFPRPVFSPFTSSTCYQVPVGPRFSLSGGPFLPLPASHNLTPAPPPLMESTSVLVPCWY